jgi:anthranilate/para-aminobenzoate synthase component I
MKSSYKKRTFWDSLGSSPYRFWLDGGIGGRTLFAWGVPLWVFRGWGTVGEFWQPGQGTRRFVLDDPLATLRCFLKTKKFGVVEGSGFGGGVVGFWGYESFLKRKRKPRGQCPPGLPDFVWVMPAFWRVERGREGMSEVSPALSSSHIDLKKNRTTYVTKVQRIKEFIKAGDIYQANLTHRLTFPWTGNPTDFFHSLCTLNPSPYGCLMEFPRFSLASCAPERLLSVRGRRITTRPIAGTHPRGKTPARDRQLSGELLLSPKERAEHIMLVDLERNDLGRVCRPGTVHVSEQMVLERYSHVIHIVSQVEGRLAPGLDALDALGALFPGGTITGCPKIRCMEILRKLEQKPRGPFYGSAGWIGLNGDAELNILIRTALFEGKQMSLQVGAGIVADSRPHKEYEETLHKAQALLAAYERSMITP